MVDLIFNTIVSKYEKHSDIRRLLSFKLISSDKSFDLSKSFSDYKFKDDETSHVDTEILYNITQTNDVLKDKIMKGKSSTFNKL